MQKELGSWMKGMEKLDERSSKKALADPVGAWELADWTRSGGRLGHGNFRKYGGTLFWSP